MFAIWFIFSPLFQWVLSCPIVLLSLNLFAPDKKSSRKAKLGGCGKLKVYSWKMGRSIRRHRTKSSLGDNILAIREGDYKNCFREGEGKHFLWYGKNMGRKFSFARFFPQKYWKEQFVSLFSLFFLIREEGALENFLSLLLGGSKIALGRGTVFLRVSLWESPPFPLPLPTYGEERGAACLEEKLKRDCKQLGRGSLPPPPPPYSSFQRRPVEWRGKLKVRPGVYLQ